MHTHYDNLQISRNASDTVIRAAYRALSQRYHPDKNPSDFARANRTMKIINEAFEVLSDPMRRAEHDLWIERQELSETRWKNSEKADASEYSNDQPYDSTGQAKPQKDEEKEIKEAAFRVNLYKDVESQYNLFSRLKKEYFEKNDNQYCESGITDKHKTGIFSRQPKYKFYQVIGWGFLVAWTTCQGFSGKVPGVGTIPLYQLLSNINYLAFYLSYYFSYVMGMFAFPLFSACIGWIIGKLNPKTRHNPSLLAAAFMIVAEAIMIVGQFFLDRQLK